MAFAKQWRACFVIIYCIICKSSPLELHWFTVIIWLIIFKNFTFSVDGNITSTLLAAHYSRCRPSLKPLKGFSFAPAVCLLSCQLQKTNRFAQNKCFCLLHQHSTVSKLHRVHHNLSFLVASRWLFGRLASLVAHLSPYNWCHTLLLDVCCVDPSIQRLALYELCCWFLTGKDWGTSLLLKLTIIGGQT